MSHREGSGVVYPYPPLPLLVPEETGGGGGQGQAQAQQARQAQQQGEDGQENLSRVLDLGSEFRKAGYDWQRRNLQDASALVDYSGAEISLSIGDWDVDGSFGDIEI